MAPVSKKCRASLDLYVAESLGSRAEVEDQIDLVTKSPPVPEASRLQQARRGAGEHTMIQGLVDRLKHRPWLALLIDGIGATLSAFSLGVVLPALEPYVGMPRRVLFVLALVALVSAACSIGSYCLRSNEWWPWLRAISRLNLAYCGVTAASWLRSGHD